MGEKSAVYTHAKNLDVSGSVPEYEALKNSDKMAKEYPFELDPFQQQAVLCMEKGDSVFVAAHTSAGKTVVAEYAVALGRQNGTRVIYTSPIKALSNQKFREFKHMFDDVGLITGDIQLNSEAYCLIMTTEILRSMLYNGSEVVRELEWVIFDEVHYINDYERGHVWEEVLIMLPDHVKIVMLSATVPNCLEFADWVGRIKNRNIYVIQTLKRPVPLEHHLYTGQDGKTRGDMFLIVDKTGQFLTTGYEKAVAAKLKKTNPAPIPGPGSAGRGGGQGKNSPNVQGKSGGRQGATGPQGVTVKKVGVGPMQANNNPWVVNKNSKNVYINLINYLRSKELLPMIVFIFSRQRCDETAQMLLSVDLTTEKEKSAIHRFFHRCIDRLTGTDKELPQVLLMQEHCKRGFAVHHSGILPIVKEVVELLFQKGLVKILLATETFAMGVNMPARSVAFDGIEKHDGKERRILNATEYVQMAGRAGRRGLDSTGTVIILVKGPTPPEIHFLKTILQGKPIKLESRFRITYGMMLNLLRVEHMRIEDMLQRSYTERASLRMVVSRKERLKQIDDEIAALPAVACALCCPSSSTSSTASNTKENNNIAGVSSSLVAYFNAVTMYYDAVSNAWMRLIQSPKELKLFVMGRVVLIHFDALGFAGRLAVILETSSTENGQFSMKLFVPISISEQDNYAKQKTYEAFNKEERKWKKLNLLVANAAANGIEGIERGFSANSTFTILDNVGLDCLMAVCKRTISKIDLGTVEAEHKKLSGPQNKRNQSQDRLIRKIMNELEQLGEKFVEQRQKVSHNGAGNDQENGDIDIETAINNEPESSSSDLFYILGVDFMDRRELALLEQLRMLRQQRHELIHAQALYPCIRCIDLQEHMKQTIQRLQLIEIRDRLAYQTSSDSLLMSGDYVNRLKVLRALNYIDRENMVLLKGKVACEISNQELLITELILDNKLSEKTPPEIAAMLSTLTCQFDIKNGNGGGANKQMPLKTFYAANSGANIHQQQQAAMEELKEEQQQAELKRVPRELLDGLKEEILEAANKIDSVQRECAVSGYTVVDELKFGLMEVVYQWASGMDFFQIMRLSEAQEGIIVRCIQRLDEVCKDVRKAALIVGSPELAQNMEETSAAIRRDIVFAASLYVTETDTAD